VRLVAFSDVHADHVTAGVDRYDDVVAALQKIVQRATTWGQHAKQADAVFFLGDLCDPDDPVRAMRAYWVMQDVAVTFRDQGIPLLAISGNHDVVESPLCPSTLHGLKSLAFVYESRGMQMNPGCNVVALPFTSSNRPYDPAAHVRECIARLDEEKRWHLPTLVLSHLMVPGAQPGEETKELARGREIVLPHEEIDKMVGRGEGRVLVLQGHYHRAQRLMLSKVEVLVVGAVQCLAHGEEQNEPSFIDMEIG
jgi:DNA repair exonuclease SbcCD nuclease subunit